MKMIDNSECLCDFGNWIREERERRELSQGEVARMLGIHQTYYGRIELAQREVDFVTAVNICAILELDISDFLKRYM